mmetsp:Transcript_25677/g.38388  ORF Transcript_25677/g.38388 Transcript_25677/m.38388 type:complete len:683 (-) Transcript_25677:206-2254(-)
MLMKISTAIALAFAPCVKSFYVPGVAMKTFAEKEPVELKVNSITSKHTQVPRSFYSLPFCKPDGGIKNKSESLGEFLTGNKIQNSGYKINMKQDSYCQILCQTPALSSKDAKKLDLAIRYEYHNNWIVDNLPSYSVGHLRNGREVTSFGGGFPIGIYLNVKESKAKTSKQVRKDMRKKFKKINNETAGNSFVFNHLRIIMQYHRPPGTSADGYRIVGFGVEPMSVQHKFVNGYKWDGSDPEGRKVPLETCNSDSNRAASHHLNVNDIVSGGQMVVSGQPILYTYDVQWQYSETTWATRWDVYMRETDKLSKEMHWMSISNSAIVLLMLSGVVAAIVVRNLRKDISGYNSLMLDEEDGTAVEDTGWKLIHADVFRPPQSHPMLFCTGVGSGVQILITSIATLLFALGGLLSPARRGSLLTCILVVYMLCGIVSGYISSRLYKSFRGRMWQRCTIFTATLFPGLCFGVFLFFNTYTAFVHSSLSIPFLDVLLVTVMFCGVQIPLVFLGAYFGYKQESISYPTKISTIARAIPEPSPSFLKPILCMIAAGAVPFSAVFVELTLVMSGLWEGEFYYVFGYLTIVFLLLCIVIAEVCVLIVYIQFTNENHRWWWLSFISGGCVALYLFLFSVDYFQDLQPSSMLITYLLYFGYMFLICTAVFLAMGSLGFLCSFYFSRAIFGSIKID